MADAEEDDAGPAPPLMGLGAHVDPDLPGPAGGQTGGWTKYLSDPVNRSALLSFGLQAMTGGWGNGTQQLAAAIGAGAQGAAGTSQQLQAQMEKTQEQQQAKEIAEGHNKTTLEAAKIGASGREAVADIRGRYSLDRANIALQKASPEIGLHYRAEARKTLGVGLESLGLDQLTISQMINSKAAEMYQNDLDRGLVKGPSTLPGGDSAGGSPRTAPASTPSATPTEGGKPAGKGNFSLNRVVTHPAFQEKIKTPEGREEILKATPDAGNKAAIQKYLEMHDKYGGAEY